MATNKKSIPFVVTSQIIGAVVPTIIVLCLFARHAWPAYSASIRNKFNNNSKQIHRHARPPSVYSISNSWKQAHHRRANQQIRGEAKEAVVLYGAYIVLWMPYRIWQLSSLQYDETDGCAAILDISLLIAASYSTVMPVLHCVKRASR